MPGVKERKTALDAANNLNLKVNMGAWDTFRRSDGNYTLRLTHVDEEDVKKAIQGSKFPDFNRAKYTFHQGKTKKDSYAEISDPAIIKALGEFNEKKLKQLGSRTSTQKIHSAFKKTSEFTIQKKLRGQDASGAFSHAVTMDTKTAPLGIGIEKKYQTTWYKKSESDKKVASTEVLAQEFFRLFEPSHPKTRLVVDPGGSTFVASQAVPGFKPIEKMDRNELAQKMLSGEYKGLGDIMVLALLLNEIDLKLGNMGVDENDRLIKIDGDWCFASLRRPEYLATSMITHETIEMLPTLSNYEAYNWMEYQVQGQIYLDSPDCYTDLQLSDSQWDVMSSPLTFRAEVNSMLLKVLLLPDELVRAMVAHYIPAIIPNTVLQNDLIEVILDRKDLLLKAASQTSSFQQLVFSDTALMIADRFSSRLEGFKMTGKASLTDSAINAQILHELENKLRPAVLKIMSSPKAPAPTQGMGQAFGTSSTASSPWGESSTDSEPSPPSRKHSI